MLKHADQGSGLHKFQHTRVCSPYYITSQNRCLFSLEMLFGVHFTSSSLAWPVRRGWMAAKPSDNHDNDWRSPSKFTCRNPAQKNGHPESNTITSMITLSHFFSLRLSSSFAKVGNSISIYSFCALDNKWENNFLILMVLLLVYCVESINWKRKKKLGNVHCLIGGLGQSMWKGDELSSLEWMMQLHFLYITIIMSIYIYTWVWCCSYT
jgi:hypothetical protein